MIYEFAKFFKSKFINFKKIFEYKKQFETLKSYVDVRTLKPASGILRKVQLKNLEFAKEVINELEQNNIQPFMFYGTLLGAERHNGFIPWDDDFDFGLMRKDIIKLLELYDGNIVYQKINHFNAVKSATKRWKELLETYPNKKVLVICPHLIKIIKGDSLSNYAQLDLFAFDYYSENYKFNDFNKFAQKTYDRMWLINNTEKEFKFVQKNIKENGNIVEYSSKIFYGMDNLDSQKNDYRNKYTDFMNASDFFPLKRMQFEDTEFWAPNNHIKILKEYFGENWCCIPDDILPPHISERTEKRSKKNE